MDAMQAESVANGQQQMTSVDIVFNIVCLYQGKPPSQASRKNLFVKNVGILRSSTQAGTLVEMTLRE
jgi:hypothetical protein